MIRLAGITAGPTLALAASVAVWTGSTAPSDGGSSSTVVLALGQLTGSKPPQAATTPAVDLQRLADDYFRPLLARKQLNAAAVIITNRDQSIFSAVYGLGNLERTTWRAASVSKALTAIAVLQLVEQGKVDLDTDVNRYLKAFQVPATFPQPITLRELLEHRSGLDDRFAGDGFKAGEQPSMTALMEQVLPARVYAPNQVEFYSNYGYALIGAVIEQVSGERFEDYLSVHVLRPIGMNGSTFTQPLAPALQSSLAPGAWWYQRAAPAGGLTTTAPDMAKFLIATLHNDSGVVAESSFRAMTPPQNATTGLVHRLGYWTGRDHGQQLIGASGDAGSFHSVVVAIPDHHLGLVVLASGRGGMLGWGFYSRLLDAEFAATRPAVADRGAGGLPTAQLEPLERFAGLYRTVRYPHHELAKAFIVLDLTRVAVDGDSGLAIDGTRWLRTGPLEFTRRDSGQTLSFAKGPDGRIDYLGDTSERIHWYQSGAASIAFYFLFTIVFVLSAWRSRGGLRWVCMLALVHSIGWLLIVLIVGPENLIFGVPIALKAMLWIGTATPLLAVAGAYAAWRTRTMWPTLAALALFGYVPFVFYWNLRV